MLAMRADSLLALELQPALCGFAGTGETLRAEALARQVGAGHGAAPTGARAFLCRLRVLAAAPK